VEVLGWAAIIATRIAGPRLGPGRVLVAYTYWLVISALLTFDVAAVVATPVPLSVVRRWRVGERVHLVPRSSAPTSGRSCSRSAISTTCRSWRAPASRSPRTSLGFLVVAAARSPIALLDGATSPRLLLASISISGVVVVLAAPSRASPWRTSPPGCRGSRKHSRRSSRCRPSPSSAGSSPPRATTFRPPRSGAIWLIGASPEALVAFLLGVNIPNRSRRTARWRRSWAGTWREPPGRIASRGLPPHRVAVRHRGHRGGAHPAAVAPVEFGR
jgi:hypothetical protein